MNRTFVTLAVILGLTGMGVSAWLYKTRLDDNRPIVSPNPEISSAALNDSISPAAGGLGGVDKPQTQQVQAPAAKASVSQISGQSVHQTPQAVGQAVTGTPIIATKPAEKSTVAGDEAKKAEEAPAEITTEQMKEIHQQVKTSIENDFKDKLSFPLDETKMIAFAQSSLKVKKINNKWDVQIAAAETDKMAIEYNNLSVEEITKSLQTIPGLTLDQYNEMTKLTAVDNKFNQTYQVYKELIEQEIVKSVPESAVVPVTTAPVAAAPKAVITSPTVPVTKPAVNSVAPVNSGIPVAPRG